MMKLWQKSMRMRTQTSAILGVIAIGVLPMKSEAQQQYQVLQKWQQYRTSNNVLYDYLADQSYDYLSARAKKVENLRSLADWQARQKEIRKTLQEVVGPFPARNPLNAKVVKTIKKQNYTAEHIIFESRPGFLVPSTLFIPNNLAPGTKAPAVLYCSGHGAVSYRSKVYQRVMLNLVNKGFIVFAFDPVGQGERLNYPDSLTGNSIVGAPTREHDYAGTQVAITGNALANYMIWDGMRAVDYLLSRPEADPARLGITGRSGGGTQSSMIAAMDDRIMAAAPEAYITSLTRLLQSIGPQDTEQNFPGEISRGLDHADLLEVRAPKPTLMITTTDDMFSIQGARETEAEVKRIYAAYGKPENFARAEDFGVHESTKNNREAMYAFMQKNLRQPGSPADEDVELLSGDETQVLPATFPPSETLFSLNAKETAMRLAQLQTARTDLPRHLPQAVVSAKTLSGYESPSATDTPVLAGTLRKKGFMIEKTFIKGEGDYMLPYLLYLPAQPNGRGMIYLDPAGKGEVEAKGKIAKYVGEGTTVLVPDLIGIGELGPDNWRKGTYYKHITYEGGMSFELWTTALLINRSIVGVRAGDVVKLVRLLKNRPGIKAVEGMAEKKLGPVLLHAAAFDNSISEITLVEPLISYRSFVTTHFYHPDLVEATVPAALTAYDLSDLGASLAPRKLTIIEPVDGAGKPANQADLEKDLSVIRTAYGAKKAENNLRIETKE